MYTYIHIHIYVYTTRLRLAIQNSAIWVSSKEELQTAQRTLTKWSAHIAQPLATTMHLVRADAAARALDWQVNIPLSHFPKSFSQVDILHSHSVR